MDRGGWWATVHRITKSWTQVSNVHFGASQVVLSDKEPTCQYRRLKRHGFHSWIRKIPGGGHGNSLQFSCLENPMDRGAWRATCCKELQRARQDWSDWARSLEVFVFYPCEDFLVSQFIKCSSLGAQGTLWGREWQDLGLETKARAGSPRIFKWHYPYPEGNGSPAT